MSRLPVADRVTVRRALRDMISRHRRAVGVVLALHSAAAVAGLAPPWLLGTIVDRVTAGAGVATVDRLALAIAGCVVVSALGAEATTVMVSVFVAGFICTSSCATWPSSTFTSLSDAERPDISNFTAYLPGGRPRRM